MFRLPKVTTTFITGGRIADVVESHYKHRGSICIFDFARAKDEKTWPFRFMEDLKNGFYMREKYSSVGVEMKEYAKIVIFTNEEIIEQSTFTYDRIVYYRIQH